MASEPRMSQAWVVRQGTVKGAGAYLWDDGPRSWALGTAGGGDWHSVTWGAKGGAKLFTCRHEAFRHAHRVCGRVVLLKGIRYVR